MELILWAAWGFAGAFVYAAPRFLMAMSQPTPFFTKLAELVIALSIGPIFAAGFGPYAVNHLKLGTDAELQALGLVIGMVANPAAPVVLKVITGNILRRLSGSSNGASGNEP